MNRRCPNNKYVGVGNIIDQEWIINERGYANIIETLTERVYGLVYELGPGDEKRLDKFEGFPEAYTKHTMEVWLEGEDGDGEVGPGVEALVYIDKKRTKEGKPKEEYIHRINKGVDDATAKGMPEDYVEAYIRRFIPAEKKEKEAVPVAA